MKQIVPMKQTLWLVIMLVGLVVSIPVRAEERTFDVNQSVEFSLANNGAIKALRQEKEIREAGKIRAGLYPNPSLELNGNTGELTGSRFENNVSVGISQEILTAGKRGKRLRVAERESEGFERQIENAEKLLKEEVKTAFYNLLLAEKKVLLAGRSIDLNRQLLEIAKERLKAGDIPELDVNLIRLEVSRSEERKSDAEQEFFPARARLLALMGLPKDVAVRFSDSFERKKFKGSMETLRKLAFSKRPDLKALDAEKAKSDAEIALAKAEGIPNITVGVDYQLENSAIDVNGEEVKSRDNFIGMKLSIPIPLFDRNQAGIREARAKKESAESRYLFTGLSIEREVEAAYARLTAAEKSLSLYGKDIIPLLEENLKLVQEAYRIGEVGIITIIEEQKKFIEVNNSYLTALYNRQTALVKLESAVATELSAETDGGEK